MSVFLFPGQGSQKAGTAKLFYDISPAARAVFDRMAASLTEDVMQVLFEGSQEDINHTRNAQPVLLCTEIAITAHLASLGIQPALCAGHSLGEIAAFTVAGAIELEDAVLFILERARLMSEEVPEGGMAAVIGMEPKEIELLLCAGTQVANYNGPLQTIISGSSHSLSVTIQALKDHGARRVLPLQVSGPFHSEYMKPAAVALERYLDSMNIFKPEVPVLSSVSGTYEDDPVRIRSLLAQQLYSPVRWTEVMDQLEKRKAVEVGPGNALAGLAKRASCAPLVFPANTPESCERLSSVL
ncbi:MAG: ACP S-malonyltransferase [Candidatus Hydrogenedentes bacterium]|nr:ACP S-malonyltransferase [Candidatus Hydrogenedentota bacterium]